MGGIGGWMDACTPYLGPPHGSGEGVGRDDDLPCLLEFRIVPPQTSD